MEDGATASNSNNNNSNNNNGTKYDPNAVIAAANSAPTLDGGRFLFQSALLEWVDDAREGGAAAVDDEGVREATATLWLAYARYLAQAKQFRSATEALEEAARCPVASAAGRVHAEAARFAVERGRRKTAQDIYIRALMDSNKVTDEQDRELLWNDFLELMRATNPELTLAALQEAVAREHAAAAAASESSNVDATATDSDPSKSGPAAKRPRYGDSAAEDSKTHVVTSDSVEQEAKQLVEEAHLLILKSNKSNGNDDLAPHQQLPPEIMAAWMSRDGNHLPQPPEYALFAPSPPKLSDPTAKDMLGLDLAVQLVERLLSPSSGGLVLEVCRGLWALQGLKEQECQAALEALDRSLLAQHERLEAELEARLSVAEAAVADAVRQMNDRERHSFQSNAVQQRQKVLTRGAWELRKVLCWQQTLLAKLDVPGFEEGPTVDDSSLQFQSLICQYLHSAFFIRNKMGAAPHESMLKSQLKKLKREQEGGTRSPMGGSSPVPPMRKHSPVPPPVYNLGTPQQQQQPMMMMQQQPQQGYSYAPPIPQHQQQQQPMMATAAGAGLPQYMPQQPPYGMMMGVPQQPPGLPPLPPTGHSQQPPLPPPPPPPPQQGGYTGAGQYPPYYQPQPR